MTEPQFCDATITYLQMLERPSTSSSLPPDARTHRLEEPSVREYRELYDAVGEAWHWADRRLISDDELLRQIAHPDVDILVLEIDGHRAGYAELDRRKWPDLQIAYFGLMPAFLGRGLGSAFLETVLDYAWDLGPARVWLHTCSLDHPAALPMYRKAGFIEYDSEVKRQRLLSSR